MDFFLSTCSMEELPNQCAANSLKISIASAPGVAGLRLGGWRPVAGDLWP